MNARSTIGKDTQSYRRGIVLGLTMAEIMLLLVFCLLIAAAAVMAHEQTEITDLETHVEEVVERATAAEAALADVTQRYQDLQEDYAVALGAMENIPDDWRELTAIKDDVRRLEDGGLTMDRAVNAASFLADVEDLEQQGVTASEVNEAVELSRALSDLLGPTPLDASEIADQVMAGRTVREREAGGPGVHDWPPIISLSEADGFYFETGSAELSALFEAALTDSVVPSLIEIIAAYDVDIIEVIGHTDEQPMARLASNLDLSLIDVLRGNGEVAALAPADNAGLGMARAAAVVKVLMSDPRLDHMTVLPLSGAQLIDTGDRLTVGNIGGDVRERRRIEIRVRRSAGAGEG